ncbi:hypothetical protein KKF61_09025 [Patescibacteria group bacterium]|nr:hypothetical protein [Patescibacteria group bacterium]
MPQTPAKIVGIGKIFNITDSVCLSNQSEFALIPSAESIKVPHGDDYGESALQTGQTFKARVGFRDMSSAIMASLINGTSTTGSIVQVNDEAVTLAAAAGTLAETPWKPTGATFAPIEIKDQNGRTFVQVAAAPATGEYVDDGDGTLTTNVADNDLVVYVTYAYADAVNGIIVKPQPSEIPGPKKMMFSGKLWSTRLGAIEGNLVVYMAKAIQSGDITVGAGVKDAGTFGFDLDLIVAVSDDLQISFPVE